jgi:hypothetical protein
MLPMDGNQTNIKIMKQTNCKAIAHGIQTPMIIQHQDKAQLTKSKRTSHNNHQNTA